MQWCKTIKHYTLEFCKKNVLKKNCHPSSPIVIFCDIVVRSESPTNSFVIVQKSKHARSKLVALAWKNSGRQCRDESAIGVPDDC